MKSLNLRRLFSLEKIAYLFVFATGFTGLVYQVVWQKYLSHYLGSHSLATSSILGIFFLFLSIGYLVIGKNSHRIMKNQFLLYGLLEALIGIYCLFSPQFFHWLHATFPAGSENPIADLALGLTFSALFIGFPTFLMGGTIPVLTQGFSAQFQTSHRTHAMLYGLNTLGAFLGTVAAGFFFIQKFGLPLTLMNTALVNLFIGLSIWLITKSTPMSFEGIRPDHTVSSDESNERGWYALLYLISFLSGFYVFSLENIMIRMTGMALGSTSYNYSLIVASFILAIALGSIIVGRKTISSARFFFATQIALLISTFVLYLSIPELPTWFMRIRILFASYSINLSPYWILVFVFLFLVLLIPVGLMGMNLPLLFNYLRKKDQYLSTVVGRIYSINTLGSVFGATIGGYFLFYFIRTDAVFKINLTLIAFTIPLISALGIKSKKHTQIAAFGAAILIALIWITPNWRDVAFSPGKFNHQKLPFDGDFSKFIREGEASINLIFNEHGPDTIVAVKKDEKGNTLYVGGNPNTGPSDVGIRTMNALVPLSLKPNPKSAFVVGLGAGLSTSLLADEPTIAQVEVAEIAKGVIDAQPYFDDQNDNLSDKLAKVKIHHSDAYKTLNSSNKKYDIIVSEPAHPWVAGVENLFTIEFLQTIKSHLTEEGVYSQWFPLFAVDDEIVYTIARSFHEVFPWVIGFSIEPSVITFIAGKKPAIVNADWILEVYQRHADFMKKARFEQPFSFLLRQTITPKTLALMAKKGGIHSLELPKIAFLSERSRFVGKIVDINHILKQNVFEPVKPSESLFLYEQVPLKAEFVEDFFKRGANVQTLATRAEVLLRSLDPKSKTLKLSRNLDTKEYFLGKTNQIPKKLQNPKFKDISDAFSVASGFITSEIPIQLNRVFRIIPKSCSELKENQRTTCISMKRSLLVNFYYLVHNEKGLDYLRDADWKEPEVESKIESGFEAVRTTLKL